MTAEQPNVPSLAPAGEALVRQIAEAAWDVPVDANLRGSDNADYYRFASRTARAFGRRVADSDPDDLALLLALRDQLDDAIGVAVEGQRQRHSWADIAAALGMSKQAVQQRWGRVTA